MTLAEVQRFIDGATWRLKQKAYYDYVLADLIGISAGRIMSKDVKFPSIEEAYPALFEEEVAKKKKEEAEVAERTQRSIDNFMSFALKLNAKKELKNSNDRRTENKTNC